MMASRAVPSDPPDNRSRLPISSSQCDRIYSASPQKLLDLLAAVVGEAPARSVFGLNNALDRLRAHAPGLADTKKFQKLLNAASVH
jgi:hypothetical protein